VAAGEALSQRDPRETTLSYLMRICSTLFDEAQSLPLPHCRRPDDRAAGIILPEGSDTFDKFRLGSGTSGVPFSRLCGFA
jgi:hypothetical protein